MLGAFLLTDIGLLAAAAFGLTWLLIRGLLPFASQLGLLDHPIGRKDHAVPTPLVGGVAMALGVMIPVWLMMADSIKPLPAFTIAATILIVVGMLDDRYDIRWYWRIGAQTCAALVMVYVGDVHVEQIGPLFGRGPMALGALSVPFTVFATVGVINAVNMADGIDGLAGALVASALLMIGCAAMYSGNYAMLPLLSAVFAAVVAFLVFNLRRPGLPRASTFMGNAGSALLGLCIAWFCFRLTQNTGHPVSPVLAPFLILFPVLDCLVLIVRRLHMGRSPFSADRGHLHHRMLDAGFTHGQLVCTLLAMSLLVGGAAALVLKWDLPHPWFVAAFFALFVLHYWVTARPARSMAFFGALHGRLFAGVGTGTGTQKAVAGNQTDVLATENESPT